MSDNQIIKKKATEEDIFDLEKHKLSKIPEKNPTVTENWMKYLGFPFGLAVFSLIYFSPAPEGLTLSAQSVIAAFSLALIWWICEPIPTYLTSLILMVLLILLDGWDSKNVLGVLGIDVIWLNVTAFVLSSVLVKTNIAKRVALNLIAKFGKNAMSILFAFVVLQLALAPLIPATAARTVITLPLMLVVALIFGSSADNPKNFGRNLFLQNLLGINIFSSGFMTGSTANLIAIGYIYSMAGTKVYYTDWMFANLPLVIILMLIALYIGPKMLFKIPQAESVPQIKGGMESIKKQLEAMGKISYLEKKGLIIFGIVVLMWVTDRFQGAWFGFEIPTVVAAIIGAIIALFPKTGVLKWNEADIPWHLMLFSAGAYAGGLALDDSGAAKWVIQKLFGSMNFGGEVNFWMVYAIIISIMVFSHYFFTSKTMRTIILIPFIITFAKQMGFNPLWLALPAAFTIDWVIGLPISAKPNVILFTTGQYSVLNNAKYGFIISVIGIILIIIFGMTWFRFLGITP